MISNDEEVDLQTCAAWNEFGRSKAFELVAGLLQNLKSLIVTHLLNPGEKDRDFYAGKLAALDEVAVALLRSSQVNPDDLREHYRLQREQPQDLMPPENPFPSPDPPV